MMLCLLLSASLLAADPAPPKYPPPTQAEIDSSVRRGIEFLLGYQNKDGSWGSAEKTKDLNIYAPVPGAHHAFRTATTALCVSALCEIEPTAPADLKPKIGTAIDRAEKWFDEHLEELRRATPDAIYNVWGHGYSLEALAHLHARHAGDAQRQSALTHMAEGQIDRLDRYAVVNGGWGYYDFDIGSKTPAGSTTSFTTATILLACRDAKAEMKVEIPQKMVDKALASIHRQRKPDGSFIYGEYLKYVPQHPVNQPGGSLGRSQVCNLVLRLYGDEKITDEVLKTWLDKLFDRQLWLDIGRKRPIPHESWFAVAGYFYYYGHYYGSRCIEQLPEADRPPYRAKMARILIDRQEKDGSWWDYPLYNYHQPYGTAFALRTFAEARPKLPATKEPK